MVEDEERARMYVEKSLFNFQVAAQKFLSVVFGFHHCCRNGLTEGIGVTRLQLCLILIFVW
jgi:hypothetical protein